MLMNAGELWDWVGSHTYPDMPIELEVGGDGAIHTGSIKSCRIEDDKVIISSEVEA